MKVKNYLFALTELLLITLLLLWPVTLWASSETRNIYIGDVITLRISCREHSAEEIKSKFQPFEITEFKDENGEYLVSLRTFEIGEHKILLGDKEIVINIKSALDDIQRESIFEGDTTVTEPGYLFNWRLLFYTTAGIFVMSGSYVLMKTILKGKMVTLSPFQIFLRRSGSLSVENDDFFVDLTFYFKEYLESLYRCRIIGKTSVEIVNELNGINLLDAMLPGIREWLTECDRLKFSGVNVSAETKKEHYEALLRLSEIVEKLNVQGVGTA